MLDALISLLEIIAVLFVAILIIYGLAFVVGPLLKGDE